MLRDPWNSLLQYLVTQREEAVHSALTGPLDPVVQSAIRKRISTIDDVLAKMKELVAHPENPGEDI